MRQSAPAMVTTKEEDTVIAAGTMAKRKDRSTGSEVLRVVGAPRAGEERVTIPPYPSISLRLFIPSSMSQTSKRRHKTPPTEVQGSQPGVANRGDHTIAHPTTHQQRTLRQKYSKTSTPSVSKREGQ